jgi:hypothetical protein
VLCLLPGPAHAVDRPISGKSLRIVSTASGARLAFLSRDPSFLFPAIGGADDPATGSPGGIVVEIFAPTEPTQTVSAPPGVGNPGWKVVDGANDSFTYRGGAPSLRKALLREARLIKLSSDDAGLSLAAPLGRVAIRITTGSLRNCAVFDASTVVRDQPGRFVARDASAAGLSDCSDASLLGQAPCGGSEPACDGTCAAGEECVGLVGGLGTVESCVCTPIGTTPCGAGGATCEEGACPAGEECQSVDPYLMEPFCTCIDPNVLCGDGQPGGYCPPDSTCQAVPGGQFTCVPISCSGPYPTCGGTCGAGMNCVPVTVGEGGPGLCVCATPENECEGLMCGGLSCPAGESCTLDIPSTGCACEPL